MTARDVAENVWLALIARLSMIAVGPIFALTMWLGGQWLDQRFDAQAAALSSVVQRVQQVETDRQAITAVQTDLTVIKSTITAKGQQRDAQIGSLERPRRSEPAQRRSQTRQDR